MLRWLELADIALRKKPKPTTYEIIADLPFGARKFSVGPTERSMSYGKKGVLRRNEWPRKVKNSG